jgi:hypothetical protein
MAIALSSPICVHSGYCVIGYVPSVTAFRHSCHRIPTAFLSPHSDRIPSVRQPGFGIRRKKRVAVHNFNTEETYS